MNRLLKWIVGLAATAFLLKLAAALLLPGLMAYGFVRVKLPESAMPEAYLLPSALARMEPDADAPSFRFKYVRFRSPWGRPVRSESKSPLSAMMEFADGRKLGVFVSTGPAVMRGFEDPKKAQAIRAVYGPELLESMYGFNKAIYEADPRAARPLMVPRRGVALLTLLILKTIALPKGTSWIGAFELPTARGHALAIPPKKLADLRFYDLQNRETTILLMGASAAPTEDEIRRLVASIEIVP